MSQKILCTGDCGVAYHLPGTEAAQQCGKGGVNPSALSGSAGIAAPKLSSGGKGKGVDVFDQYPSEPGTLKHRHDEAAAEFGEFSDEQIAYGLHYASDNDPISGNEEDLNKSYRDLIDSWENGYRPVSPELAANNKVSFQAEAHRGFDGYGRKKGTVGVYSGKFDDSEGMYVFNTDDGEVYIEKSDSLMIEHSPGTYSKYSLDNSPAYRDQV